MKRMMQLLLLTVVFVMVLVATYTLGAGAFVSFGGFNASTDRSEWLASDISIINNLAKVLPINDTSYMALEKKLVALGFVNNITRSVGFGSKIVYLVTGGGYASFHFSMLIIDDEIASVKLDIHLSGDREKDVRKHLKAVLDIGEDAITEDESGVYYIFHFGKAEDVLKERVSQYLGPLTASIPARYSADYYLLIDPLQELEYGEACGWAASPPLGREAIERLITGKQYDLIEDILRGHNPEGRIYAAEATLRIGKELPQIVSRNQDVITKLLSLDIEIDACYGCFGGYSKAHDLLTDFLLEDNK